MDVSILTDAQLAAERTRLRGLPRGKRKPDKLREINRERNRRARERRTNRR